MLVALVWSFATETGVVVVAIPPMEPETIIIIVRFTPTQGLAATCSSPLLAAGCLSVPLCLTTVLLIHGVVAVREDRFGLLHRIVAASEAFAVVDVFSVRVADVGLVVVVCMEPEGAS